MTVTISTAMTLVSPGDRPANVHVTVGFFRGARQPCALRRPVIIAADRNCSYFWLLGLDPVSKWTC